MEGANCEEVVGEQVVEDEPELAAVGHNLEIANQMITDRIEPTPRLFIWDYWDSIKQFQSLQGLTAENARLQAALSAAQSSVACHSVGCSRS